MGFFGNTVWPLTQTTGDFDGEVGPQNSLSTENMAPVSRRKLKGCPSTRMDTLGSRKVMTFLGRGVPRARQSSNARLQSSRFGVETDPAPCGAGTIYRRVNTGMALGAWPWWWPGIGAHACPLSIHPPFKTGPGGNFGGGHPLRGPVGVDRLGSLRACASI